MSAVRPPEQDQGFLAGGGETGALMRAHDWSGSPLGEPSTWPQSLRSVVGILLNSKFPMFVAWGAELGFLYNDPYAEILGTKHPAALGRRFHDIWSEIWPDISPLIDAAMAGEATYRKDLPLLMNRKGFEEETWFTFSYSPVRDESGAVAGMFCACTETTEQVLTERKLLESEERFRLIADSAPVPMWVTRLDRTRGFVNRAYVDFLGITYDEAVDFDWRTIIHPDDEARIIAESIAGEASLETFTMEARFHRGDGDYRWLRSISQPRWGPSGEHVGFIGVAHDISEWKQAEVSLRELNETLERSVAERTVDLREALERLQTEVADRERIEEALRQAQKMEAVGRLTGGIAHDFNNLLTPVIGGLELIVGRLDDERLKRLAEAALESSRRGAKLTTQLLAFSRLQRIRMSPVAVDDVIGNLRRILKHTIGTDIDIRTELGAGRLALCDENQLENAVLNLALNARDAMPEGGTLTISTELCREPCRPELQEGDYIRISVADTGQGMAPDVAARAVEPFFTTKPFGKGTGLGLAQVYGIARQSGGTVLIESEEGVGTTIHIFLPLVDQAATGAAESVEDRTPAALEAGPPARILIVDDDPDVRSFLAGTIADFGHQVLQAADGADALALLDKETPDLMLVDFAMPGMNGAALARTARQRLPELPIVFVTGYAESDQLDGALVDVPVLRKPFGVTALAAALREVLQETPERS